jgi:AhpD family alkylhydroperoxidase
MGDKENKKEETCETNKSEIRKTNTNKASIKMIEESKATGKVKEVYEDIKKTLGIDFVPNMYKAIANNPSYLEITWEKIQDIMSKSGKLDSKTKDIIALTVSIMSGCEYCINVYNDAVKNNGLDDEALLELYNVIDVYSGLNRLNIGTQVKQDEKPWHGCGKE